MCWRFDLATTSRLGLIRAACRPSRRVPFDRSLAPPERGNTRPAARSRPMHGRNTCKWAVQRTVRLAYQNRFRSPDYATRAAVSGRAARPGLYRLVSAPAGSEGGGSSPCRQSRATCVSQARHEPSDPVIPSLERQPRSFSRRVIAVGGQRPPAWERRTLRTRRRAADGLGSQQGL